MSWHRKTESSGSNLKHFRLSSIRTPPIRTSRRHPIAPSPPGRRSPKRLNPARNAKASVSSVCGPLKSQNCILVRVHAAAPIWLTLNHTTSTNTSRSANQNSMWSTAFSTEAVALDADEWSKLWFRQKRGAALVPDFRLTLPNFAASMGTAAALCRTISCPSLACHQLRRGTESH
jgi:hypothetical protein